MFNIVTVKKTLFNETSLWANRVQAAGGGFETNSVAIANNLVRQIKNASFGAKIVYLLPMLGTGIGAARVPLLDTLNVGSATNTAFVNADFSQSAGLQGNGSTKYLTVPLKPSQLGLTNNGGIGWYENNISFAGTTTEIMGNIDNAGNNRYTIDLRSGRRFFSWGNAGNAADQLVAAVNGHYYGQRASTTDRKLYLNGLTVTTNTTSDAAAGASDRNMLLMGCDESGSIVEWAGRCAATYFTDGTMTDAEALSFDALLRAYLLGPTGKPQT